MEVNCIFSQNKGVSIEGVAKIYACTACLDRLMSI